MGDPKFKMIKSRVIDPTRKMTVKWDLNIKDSIFSYKRKPPETKEEEAEEIIRRLQRIRNGYILADEIAEAMSYAITQEIDAEILKHFRNVK